MLPSPDHINRPLADPETTIGTFSAIILQNQPGIVSSIISHRASWSCPFIWAKYTPAHGKILPRILILYMFEIAFT
jgi:hypothetical protein